jgi:cytochrome P450
MMSATATMTFPAGPRGHFLLGNLPDLRKRPLQLMEESVRDYGDITHYQIANIHAYLINRPDWTEQILVTDHKNFMKPKLLRDTAEVFGRGLLVSEGDFWLRQRRLMAPAFHRKRISEYGVIMTDYAEQMMNNWRDGDTRDIHEDMMHVTLGIVTRTLFGSEIGNNEMERVGRSLEVALERFVDRISLLRFLDTWPLPKNLRFKRALADLDSIIYGLIEERRKTKEDRGDLLSMLLHAQDDDGTQMTDRQVRDESITIFLAGHETTAIALTWTWYLLSKNPEVERKMAMELLEVLGDRTPTLDDLPKLEYTAKVVKESMRLYPPAWRVGREALVDCEFGGFTIPAGAQLIMSQWTIQRDARYYPEPLAFKPERWTEEFTKDQPRFAYFPFGSGPRICIGDQFAMMEATLILAAMARRFRLELVPSHPIEYWPSITLRPRFGMKMVIRRQPGFS